MDVADNPWNSPETIEKWAARMTKEEKRMRLHGEFVHLGGLFYGEFSEHLHVLDKEVPIDHLKGQDVVIGIDPGKNTAVVWVCFDKE
ncbi:hypothetical protein LRR18_17690, partial [Mangrovimonas sp. AS39]|uniref:hypothetical protein n=1 Tax=Mangrovimonas futianensis TaxID=2895523 RepID=UPI001E5384A8